MAASFFRAKWAKSSVLLFLALRTGGGRQGTNLLFTVAWEEDAQGWPVYGPVPGPHEHSAQRFGGEPFPRIKEGKFKVRWVRLSLFILHGFLARGCDATLPPPSLLPSLMVVVAFPSA